MNCRGLSQSGRAFSIAGEEAAGAAEPSCLAAPGALPALPGTPRQPGSEGRARRRSQPCQFLSSFLITNLINRHILK